MPASSTTGTSTRLADQGDVVRVADPHAAADRRAERHHRGAAEVGQAPRQHGIIGRVGEHHEAVVDELLGGAQQLGRVGQQRVLVADHLELDPVGLERLARELRGEHGIARGVAAGRVRQQLHAGLRRAPRPASRAAAGSTRRSATVTSSRAAGRDRLGRAARARGSRRCRAAAASAAAARRSSASRRSRRRGSRAARGPARRSLTAHASRISHHPPCIAVSTSTRASLAEHERSHRARGTTSPSTATATPRASGVEAEAREQRRDRVSPARERPSRSPLSRSRRAPPRRRAPRLAVAVRRPPGEARGVAAREQRRRARASPGEHAAATSSARQRRQQDAVAVVAGRPDQARRARRGRSRAALSGVPGRRPTRQLLDLQLADPRHSSWASRSSS